MADGLPLWSPTHRATGARWMRHPRVIGTAGPESPAINLCAPWTELSVCVRSVLFSPQLRSRKSSLQNGRAGPGAFWRLRASLTILGVLNSDKISKRTGLQRQSSFTAPAAARRNNADRRRALDDRDPNLGIKALPRLPSRSDKRVGPPILRRASRHENQPSAASSCCGSNYGGTIGNGKIAINWLFSRLPRYCSNYDPWPAGRHIRAAYAQNKGRQLPLRRLWSVPNCGRRPRGGHQSTGQCATGMASGKRRLQQEIWLRFRDRGNWNVDAIRSCGSL